MDEELAKVLLLRVKKIAASRYGMRGPFEELVAEGMLACCEAFPRWKEGGGASITSVCLKRAEWAMQDWFRKHDSDCGIRRWERIKAKESGHRIPSRIVHGGIPIEYSKTPSFETQVIANIDAARMLSRCTWKQAAAVRMVWLRGDRMFEVAKRLGITEGRVSQLCSQGIRKMRESA